LLIWGSALLAASPARADDRHALRLDPGGGAAAEDPRLAPLSSRVPLKPAAGGIAGGIDPLEARIALGPRPGGGRRVVLYREAAGLPYSRLLIDTNGDGSVEDEEALVTQMRTSGQSTWSAFDATVQVAHDPKGGAATESYELELYVVVQSPTQRPDNLAYRGKGMRTGQVDLDGMPHEVTISDRNNDAVFTVGDAWTMRALHGADPDAPIDVKRVGESIALDGRFWVLELEGTAGRSATLVRQDGPANPAAPQAPGGAHPEDAAAPRASASLSFADDYQEGRERAQKEQAPYLLSFERDSEPACGQMHDLVYGAASVVEAARGLVCIRVDANVDEARCREHGVDTVPTGILFDPSGEELGRFEGYTGIDKLLALLAEANPYLAPSDQEPDLQGRAKRRHKDVVSTHLAFLEDGKGHGLLVDRIAVLGTRKTRGSRDALIEFATNRKSKEYVAAAFEAIARIGGVRSIEFLCSKDGLRSGDFLVAQTAAQALGLPRDPRATKALLDVMTNRRTKIEVVFACAISLAKSAPQDEEVVATIFEYSRHQKDTIRAGAVEALGYLRSDDAVARLKDVLVSDKNTRVRCAAAWGMGHTGRTELIPVLRAALEGDNSHTVRTAVLDAVKELQGETE